MEEAKKLKSLQITTIDLTAYCFLRTWFKYLCDHGFDVTLSTTVEQFQKDIEETGAKVINIPIARGIDPLSDFISLIKLYKHIKKEKYDCVQTYTTKAGFVGRLAAKLAGVPIVIHNMLEPPHNSTKNPILRAVYIFMERLASNWADQLMTTTQPNVKEILDKKLVRPDKLTAVPEGLVIEKYDSVTADPKKVREELGIPDNGIFILTAARLEKAKGHIYLLEAAKMLLKEKPNLYFICVGKGALEELLKAKTAELGIENNVKFTGFKDNMPELMKSCDLFVLPSLYEGQGVVLMEAMALKKPLVASRVGGVVDVVIEDKTGILVPSEDPGALASAIKNILKDPDKMTSMGEAGYMRIKEHFNDSEFNRRRYEVYKKLFKKKLNISIPD